MSITPEVLNSLILLGIAGFNALAAFMAWRTNQAASRTEASSKANGVLLETVHNATNSMKDALVTAAGKEGFREGVDSATKVEIAIEKLPKNTEATTATEEPVKYAPKP